MRLLALDGRMGASGDMLLAALLAAGADRDALAPAEETLDVRYDVGETTKNGISATTVDVLVDEGDDGADGNHDHHDETHGHSHDHDHDETHGHDGHVHAEGHGPNRTYSEVVALVESMGLPAAVEADALAVFERLGEAEARVHGTDLADTHFHEVGADDAIADVVGVALLLADLGVERVVTTPLAAGGGETTMSHGTYPVPTPAVTYIAEGADWELRGGPVEAELLTPTGAAILAHVAEGVDSLPSLRVERVGYGAGGYTFPEHPNVLRATVGESAGGLRRDPVRVLETNVDDVEPELLGGLQERLVEAGARDVSIVPLTMKKSRPGHLVKVVVKPADAERVARLLAEETGTLGVRETGVRHRFVADRRLVTATLLEDGARHAVGVKVASDTAGTVFDVSAEYDDAAAVARETGLATREVARRAEAAAREGGALAEHLVHVVEAEQWAAFEGADRYAPPSLEEEGFVHAATPEWVVSVAQSTHADAEEPLLLVIDRAAIEPEVRYEEQPLGAFPHVYGELNTDAVVGVHSLPRDEDGQFTLPDALARER